MTEKIKQFDTWFANAKSGDTYKYFTGNLAYSIGRADGFELKKLKKYIMDKCCEWNLEDKPMKDTDNKIQFKSKIRLVQKGQKIIWDKKKENEAFRDSDYIAIKL